MKSRFSLSIAVICFNKLQSKQKGQSRMTNPETTLTLVTQDEYKQNTKKRKNNKENKAMSNMDLTQKQRDTGQRQTKHKNTTKKTKR